jgi:transposase
MCLKPRALPPIPEDTQRVSLLVFRRRTLALRLGDELADVLGDEDFADLYSPTGQPALSPALLA